MERAQLEQLVQQQRVQLEQLAYQHHILRQQITQLEANINATFGSLQMLEHLLSGEEGTPAIEGTPDVAALGEENEE